MLADTRKMYVNSLGNPTKEPYDATWKILQLGSHALGAFAGLDVRGLHAITKASELFHERPFPPKAPQTVERLVSLLEAGSAMVDDATPDIQLPPEVETVIAYIDASDGYNLLTWSNAGLQRVTFDSAARGPFLIGSGRASSGGDTFESEINQIRSKDGGRLFGVAAHELYFQAGIVAAAFYNSFFRTSPDVATGGGVQIYTISLSGGIEELELCPYEGEPGDGYFVHATPSIVTSYEPKDSGPVPARMSLPEEGEILCGIVDHHDQFFSIRRSVSEVAGIRFLTEDEMPPEALEALLRKYPGITFDNAFRRS